MTFGSVVSNTDRKSLKDLNPLVICQFYRYSSRKTPKYYSWFPLKKRAQTFFFHPPDKPFDPYTPLLSVTR